MISKEKLFLTICMGIIISFFLLAGPWTIISEGVIFPNFQAPIFQGIPFDNPHFPFEEDFFPPTQNPLLNWPSQPGFSFPGRGPFSNWANHPIFGPQSGMNFSPSWAGAIPQVMDILGSGAVVPVIDMTTISNPLPRVDFNLGLPLLAKESMSPVKEASTASTGMQLQSETITANAESENTKPIPTLQLQHKDIANSQKRIKRVNVLERRIPVRKFSTSKPVVVSQHSTRESTFSSTSGKEEVSSIKSKRLPYREGEVLVRFREGVTETDALNQIQSVYKLSETKRFPTISRIMGKEYMLVGQKGVKAKDLIEMLKNDPLVERVSLNYSGEFFSDCEGTTPNDEYFDTQWSLCNTGQEIVCFGPDPWDCVYGTPGADIKATKTWDLNTGSKDIVVAVVDTGVGYNHPDLIDNMWNNTAELNGDPGVDDDHNGYTDDIWGIDPGEDDTDPDDVMGHGTAVAGLIGAMGNNEEGIAGVNWETRIMAIKVATADFGLFVADAVEAMEYILYWKDKGENIVAMNASWGLMPEFENPEEIEILRDAVEALGREGIILVAAVANNGENNDDGDYDPVPASFDLPNIVAVAATDWDDYLFEWSNYGPISVDLGAPGDLLWTTFMAEMYIPGGEDDIFFDDMESGSGNWIADEPWEITNENYISPDNAWSDSPGGNYPNDLYSDLTTIPIDLSGESGPLGFGFMINFELEEYYDWLDLYFKVQKPSYWEITDENAHESTYAWSDSPNGNYPDYTYSWLVSPIIDLSGADFAAQLSFWLTGIVEEWYDYLIVLYSNDGGASWDDWGYITGDFSDQWYHFFSDYIPPYYRTSQFRVAFVLESDFIINYDGYYIDDVMVQDSSTVFFYDDMESGASAWSRPAMENWDYQFSFTGPSDGWWGISVPLYEGCYWNGFQARFSTWYDFSINFDGVYIDDVGIGSPELIYDYILFGGTSGSAPLVTGALALLAAEHTGEGPRTLINRILDGVDPLTSLQGMVATGGRLNLYNSITMEMPSILDQINNILEFFNQSVEDGRLWGTGPNSKVADQRIKTIRSSIERAVTLIDGSKPEKACGLLLNIYNLTDGASAPPDFVAGPATTQLAFMILDLRINLGCPML